MSNLCNVKRDQPAAMTYNLLILFPKIIAFYVINNFTHAHTAFNSLFIIFLFGSSFILFYFILNELKSENKLIESICVQHTLFFQLKLQLQLIRLICISMRLKTLGFTKRLDLTPYHITNDTDAMFLFLNAPMRILLFFYYF